MGWDSCDAWTTKKALKEELLASYARNGEKVLAVASGRYGYWFALEKDGRKFVMCVLVEKEGGSYGFKEMHECEGPFYYDCPEKVFKHVRGTEAFGPGSAGWRTEVTARLGGVWSPKAVEMYRVLGGGS